VCHLATLPIPGSLCPRSTALTLAHPPPSHSLKSISSFLNLPLRPSHETPLKHPATTREQGEAVGGRVTANDYRDYLGLPGLPVPAMPRSKNARSKLSRAPTYPQCPGTRTPGASYLGLPGLPVPVIATPKNKTPLK
jgi:hypothetical protein